MIIPWQPQVLGRAFQVIEPFWSTVFVQSGCFHELSSEHLQLVQNGNQKTTPNNKKQDSIFKNTAFTHAVENTDNNKLIYKMYTTVSKMALLIEPFMCLHNL